MYVVVDIWNSKLFFLNKSSLFPRALMISAGCNNSSNFVLNYITIYWCTFSFDRLALATKVSRLVDSLASPPQQYCQILALNSLWSQKSMTPVSYNYCGQNTTFICHVKEIEHWCFWISSVIMLENASENLPYYLRTITLTITAFIIQSDGRNLYIYRWNVSMCCKYRATVHKSARYSKA